MYNMTNQTHELLKFSTIERCDGAVELIGTAGYAFCTGSDGVRRPFDHTTCTYTLGSEPVGGTITGALRQFNLPTSRAPGDWPEPTVNGTVRY